MDKLPPLYQAVITGDVKQVKKLLTKAWFRKPADINGADTNRGFSPLQRAVETKQNKVVRLLLKHKPAPDVNLCFAGATAMDLAISKNNKEAIGWLREAGAKTARELRNQANLVEA
jgi:ankyrin repeat protein